MNEVLTTAAIALVLLAGLAALIRYVAHDVFSDPVARLRSERDVTGLREAVPTLGLPHLDRR